MLSLSAELPLLRADEVDNVCPCRGPWATARLLEGEPGVAGVLASAEVAGNPAIPADDEDNDGNTQVFAFFASPSVALATRDIRLLPPKANGDAEDMYEPMEPMLDLLSDEECEKIEHDSALSAAEEADSADEEEPVDELEEGLTKGSVELVAASDSAEAEESVAAESGEGARRVGVVRVEAVEAAETGWLEEPEEDEDTTEGEKLGT